MAEERNPLEMTEEEIAEAHGELPPERRAMSVDREVDLLSQPTGVDEDELTLAAAEGGADDVSLDGSTYEVVSAPEALAAVRAALESAGFTVENAELTMVPKTTVEVADESAAKKILRLIDQLEESDDIQDVYANFDIPEQVLETVAS